MGEFYKIDKFKKLKNLIFRFKRNWAKRSREINTNAGFYFKNREDIQKFYQLYHEALIDTDVLGCWGTAFAWIEYLYFRKIDKLIKVTMTAPWVESFSSESSQKPWSRALDGKRVLVVSPFVDTIIMQHININNVFPSTDYPKFTLLTIKSPQTIGFRGNTEPSWFDHLNKLKNLMQEQEFDVALIAAGAYSFPLAHHAKKMGKIGIHSGGNLQVFFGIMGKRWERNWGKGNYIEKFYNKFWTRPSVAETPKGANMVEGGCYW